MFSTDVPHLRIIKNRTFLPKDVKSPLKNNVAFLCNVNENKLTTYFNYRIAYHDNKYSTYFIDNMYKGKIGGISYIANKKPSVVEHYKFINDTDKRIMTVKNIPAARNKNLYFSLMYENQIFFDKSKKIPFQKKVLLYIEKLRNILADQRLSSYTNKFVMINVEEWLEFGHNNPRGKYLFHDPINILFITMKKYFNDFATLGDINFIIFTQDAFIRLNPSLCDKNTYSTFRRELIKLNKTFNFLEDEKLLDDEIKKSELINDVISGFNFSRGFTGETGETMDETIKDRLEELQEENEDASKDELEEMLNNDEKLIKELYTQLQSTKTGKSEASSKRDEELRKRQQELQLKGTKLKDLEAIDASTIKLRETDISSKVKSTNKNVHTVRYPDFEKSYNDTLYKKDMSDIIMSLNNKSLPVFVKDIKVEDTSDELNLKETYTVTLEDSNRVRHTLKVDMPVFMDDKFMYLGGNKKIIIKQLAMKPVVKTSPDSVQICTNYNKMFIRRYGQKVSPKIEKLNKLFSSNEKYPGITYLRGNHRDDNIKFKSSIEYDELSSHYDRIIAGNTKFLFSQKEVNEELEKLKLTVKDNELCIGFKGKEPILLNLDTHSVDGKDIVDLIVENSSKEFVEKYNETKVGKKFMYSRSKVMRREIPTVLLICFYEGISTVLKKANIKHYFSDTRVRINPEEEGIVEFSDGYLVYDKYPFENSLLMNAFADIPTKAFSYADLDDKEAYLDIFDAMYGSRGLGGYLLNFYEFMIDPITEGVLRDLGYPTDLVELILYANKLLVDNQCMKEYKADIYRVRSNEIVNVYLYNALAEAYVRYKQTSNNKNPVKMSIPRDAVLKEILTAQTIEDYSILNPIVELEKSRAITPKGPSGLNQARAYTEEKRSYDKSMLGICAISTSPDAGCGVVRQLTLEPNIIGPRGYIQNKENKLDELKDVNLFAPAELLSPLGVTRDDTIRTAIKRCGTMK